MRASVRVPATEPTETVRQICEPTDIFVGSVIGDVAKMLWPRNTAPELASRVGCSVRTIERQQASGDWSGDAIAAIVSEILKRHAMRHVKVAAR